MVCFHHNASVACVHLADHFCVCCSVKHGFFLQQEQGLWLSFTVAYFSPIDNTVVFMVTFFYQQIPIIG